MTATKSNKGLPVRVKRETAVEAFLLQQHQAYLYRLVVSGIFYRVACLAIVGFVVLVNYLSIFQFEASGLVAFLIANLWFSERRIVSLQLTTLEQSLAQRSGDDWEDFYIKSRYETSSSERVLFGPWLYKLEPLLWLVLIIALASFRFWLERSKAIVP